MARNTMPINHSIKNNIEIIFLGKSFWKCMILNYSMLECLGFRLKYDKLSSHLYGSLFQNKHQKQSGNSRMNFAFHITMEQTMGWSNQVYHHFNIPLHLFQGIITDWRYLSYRLLNELSTEFLQFEPNWHNYWATIHHSPFILKIIQM